MNLQDTRCVCGHENPIKVENHGGFPVVTILCDTCGEMFFTILTRPVWIAKQVEASK